MKQTLKVGIIGDFRPDNRTHRATNEAIAHTGAVLGISVDVQWVPTPSLVMDTAVTLDPFDALWCSPGSPYDSMDGALQGIRFAREVDRPFLGT